MNIRKFGKLDALMQFRENPPLGETKRLPKNTGLDSGKERYTISLIEILRQD